MTDVDTVVENLDKELSDIMDSVDVSVKAADDHIKERLLNGENESVLSAVSSSKNSVQSSPQSGPPKLSNGVAPKSCHATPANSQIPQNHAMPPSQIHSVCSSSVSSHGIPPVSHVIEPQTKQANPVEKPILVVQQKEVQDASERLENLQKEQNALEKELQKKSEIFELNKQRIKDAQSIVFLNKARVEDSKLSSPTAYKVPPTASIPTSMPVKLKGVQLPIFSGENKAEFEAWNAAFTAVVDNTDMPVKKKMLRLQNCLRGKALEIVRDLGYSSHGYEKAKEKLERKYGGKRGQTLSHLATLRGLSKVRRHNLEDMEELLAVIDRILVALQDGDEYGEIKGQHLGLTVKEKLPEEYVREYKFWLHEQRNEDSFEKLAEWIDTRVQIMDEAKEETGEFDKRQHSKDGERRYNRGHHTASRSRKCIVTKCTSDHPPWVCPEFKKLSFAQRKELISKSGRCFRCLAAGHSSKNCPRNRKCGINGCESYKHSSYLHDPEWRNTRNDTPQLSPEHTTDEKNVTMVTNGNSHNNTTYNTAQVEKISLMVLPAVIGNGPKKLKVNIMLDPCSTGSYITESAAEELQLNGERQDLTISGTGGTEIKKQSRRVHCSVSSIDGLFSAPVEANVLDNITGNTPAIEWSTLKNDWPHLTSIAFDQVSNRKQVDMLIGSDHPIFHKVLRKVNGKHPKDPVARQTPLGWVCFGPTSKNSLSINTHAHMTRTYRTGQVNVDETNDLLRKFWELDAIGIRDNNIRAMTKDETKAMETAQSTQMLKDGRYEIGIPWKEGEPEFRNNFEMAFSRLSNLETSLLKKPEIASAYCEIIKDYVDKEYVRKVPMTDEEQWFLPHFAVVSNQKTSTKVRIVFDAAAKLEGKSLNDAIHSGPKLQRELVDVLTRFRRAPVALSADISQMFLQVGLAEKDRRFHRFLWRGLDLNKEPEVYEFTRLP